MQAIAFTIPNGSIKCPLQRRQLSSILGGVGNLLSGGTLTPKIDQSTGTNPSTSASQPLPPRAETVGPSEQPVPTNPSNASRDATPSTSANPPVSPTDSTSQNLPVLPMGSTTTNLPALPMGSTTANLPVLPVGSTTTPVTFSNSTTDLPTSPVSNNLASNSTKSTAGPDVSAKNTTATVDSTPTPASTADVTTPNSANTTSMPPGLNSTTTSNATVAPIVPLTTFPDSTGLTTPTTDTVSVTDTTHTPVSSILPGPLISLSSQPKPEDSSTGLSTGTLTGIAIIAGVVGFIILFWIGVQILQYKRQKHEEANIQEIQFNLSRGSSVNGDTFPDHGHNQQTPASAGSQSFGQNFSTQDHGDTQYENDAHMCTDYVSSTEPASPNMAGIGRGALNHPPTVGAVSFHSNQSVKHTQGYYGQDFSCQPSYSYPSGHGQYSSSYPCFGEGPPMPTYPYEYHNKPGQALNYHGDLHNPGYQGAGGMSYGNMVAQSDSLTHPPVVAEFCYPPPNNSPHMDM